MVIWKYPLEVADLQHVRMPAGAVPLSVAAQAGQPTLWAMVDPGAAEELVAFRTFGTGHTLPDAPGRYVGTYLIRGDSLVFHVFVCD